MNISVILAHPDKASFNHAIAAVVRDRLASSGHRIAFHDLCAEGFDPLLPACEIPSSAVVDPAIRAHCDEIAQADGIVIIHPNWWGMPPAILKGWVDRVLRAGVAYRFLEGDSGEGVPQGLLKARAVVILNTSNTQANREMEVFGDPLETIWKNCIFGLCSEAGFHRRTFGVVVTSTQAERKKWLEEAAELVSTVFAAGNGA